MVEAPVAGSTRSKCLSPSSAPSNWPKEDTYPAPWVASTLWAVARLLFIPVSNTGIACDDQAVVAQGSASHLDVIRPARSRGEVADDLAVVPCRNTHRQSGAAAVEQLQGTAAAPFTTRVADWLAARVNEYVSTASEEILSRPMSSPCPVFPMKVSAAGGGVDLVEGTVTSRQQRAVGLELERLVAVAETTHEACTRPSPGPGCTDSARIGR